jgi:hypothetical protein
MILLSGRMFALIRELSFARIKGFAITRNLRDQVAAMGIKRRMAGMGRDQPATPATRTA